MTNVTREVDCIRVKGQTRKKVQERITVESRMTLFVNDQAVSEFIYSAGHEEHLVSGYLVSSGRISSLSQIERIDLKGEDCIVSITDLTESSDVSSTKLEINHDRLLEVREALISNQKNHFATRGFHGAIIWEIPTGKWFMCEDIGRHNAVDKVIGYGKQNGYTLSQSMVLLSGRLVSNIVSKCSNSGIPLMASMTVATDIGIELAKKSDMTIVGSLSKKGFWLYNEGKVKIS